jgi:hypothetical protein
MAVIRTSRVYKFTGLNTGLSMAIALDDAWLCGRCDTPLLAYPVFPRDNELGKYRKVTCPHCQTFRMAEIDEQP